MSEKKNIDSIYPLSPVQQGMLFHTLLAPKSGVYFNQALYTLTGFLQKMAMQRAWRQVVDRHEALRTLFVWQAREKPLQVVRRRVTVPWQELDWRGLSADEQNAKLAAFLQADRQHGFDLTQAPLMRLALIRLGENHHELIWSNHHLLIDGWSSFLILKDVMTVYQAICDGRDCRLELVRPYRDFINWQQGQDLSKAEEFWREALKGFAAPTPLLGSPGAEGHEVQDYELTEQLGSTPPSLTAALKSFARKNDLTLGTIVQGTWAILLSRYSGETDVVFGSTVSGRSVELVGIESMVGLFINTLPVRAQFSSQVATLAWLKDFQDKLVKARQYEHSPLVDVQGWSEVRRGHPLFQSLVAFENYPVDASVWGQDGTLQISNMRVVVPTNYPLAIAVVPRKELSIRVSYDSRRFDGAAISRMLGHFNTLLEGIIANPGWRPAELPMLTEAERQQVLYEWNDTKADFPQDKCIQELFEQQVERDPDAVAVVYQDRSLSYGELNARCNRLAHHLRGLGVGPDVLVAICVERSLEMVVGLLAILKAGGAYVPLDPVYPAERLAFMIEDSAPAVILSHAPTRLALAAAMADLARHPPILDLEADLPLWTGQPIANHDPAAAGLTSSHLAYVIYTSGSTGTPKGVAVTHTGLCNYVAWAAQYYRLDLGSGAPILTPLAFDATVTSLFLPILAGKLVLLLPEEKQMENLTRIDCNLGEFSLLKLTPAHLDALNYSAPFKSLRQLTHCIVIGGESLNEATVVPWRQHAPQIRLINEYGPTESVVGCAVYEVQPSDPNKGSVPIGRPISNTRIYLLDEGLEPVPVGVAGEIYIGGAGVARGYLNRPELTAERFIASPFVAGDRLYKTGDLGRYLADGNIEFLGRNDFQVKIRGYRIELGEIEARLSSCTGVREAVVLAREDVPGDKRLVAYYTAAGGDEPGAEALRARLAASLPEHMLPAAYVRLEVLPLTPNGKLDRKALPAPDVTAVARAPDHVPPRNDAERGLAGLWEGILGVHPIGIRDDFFALGGNSLLAIQTVVRMDRELGIKLNVADLFEAPTVERLVAWVAERTQDQNSSRLIPVSSGGTRPPLFVVPSALPDNGYYLAKRLCARLGPDQPVYCLQLYDPKRSDRAFDSIEALASYCVSIMVSDYGRGPFKLIGYSLGATIAYEVACQLSEAGHQVQTLALIDTGSTAMNNSLLQKLHRVPAFLTILPRLLWWKLKRQGSPSAVVLKSRIWLHCLWSRTATGVHHHFLIKELPDDLRQAAHERLGLRENYKPKPYRGRMVLFRARVPLDFRLVSLDLGWRKVSAGGIDIIMLPGDHNTVIEDDRCLSRICAVLNESGGPYRTQGFIFWTRVWSRCRLAWRARSSLAWRG